MPELKGSCRCSKVTYVASGDPVFTGVCHCTTCRKATGSAFATVFGIPQPAVTITGTTTRFESTGDSGKPTHRIFCPICGTTIAQGADVMAGILMIPVGTLDDPSLVSPGMQIYCDSALPWAVLPGMQQVAKMP